MLFWIILILACKYLCIRPKENSASSLIKFARDGVPFLLLGSENNLFLWRKNWLNILQNDFKIRRSAQTFIAQAILKQDVQSPGWNWLNEAIQCPPSQNHSKGGVYHNLQLVSKLSVKNSKLEDSESLVDHSSSKMLDYLDPLTDLISKEGCL